MTWNYRVIKLNKYQLEPTYAICEVYYNDDGSISGYTEPIDLTGESRTDLFEMLSLINFAFNKETLEETDL